MTSTGYWATNTDDKEAVVIASWKAGHSPREIAHALKERFGGNVTPSAVTCKAHRLKLPSRTPSRPVNPNPAWAA